MRWIIAAAGLLAIGGCKTAGDIRARHLAGQASSTKPVDELAGCVALAVTGRGIEIGKETLPNGVSITAAMRVAGVKTVMNVFDIEDLGSERRVSLYSVGGKGAPSPTIAGPAGKCI